MHDYTIDLYRLDIQGDVQSIPEVDLKIIEALDEWDANLPKENSSWILKNKSSLVKAVLFIIRWADILIQEVEGKIEKGFDKKATVLFALNLLFDYVAKEAMPIYLKPFGSWIKGFLLNTIISGLIDFMVDKYRNGIWHWNFKEDENGQESTPQES